MVNQEFKVWDEERCENCSESLEGKREAIRYNGHYFCCDKCFGAYLVEKLIDEATLVDFISREEELMMIEERRAEFNEAY